MLITLVIILLLIWAAVVWSIYSNFLIFYSNFNESENYHRAYYNSISALERAELVVKQRSPWYEWSWWWILWDEQWPGSDKLITNNFSYLSDESTRNKSSVYRTINSKTDRIPSTWQWDIEFMLATGDSTDYNKMDYSDTQVFLLYYDPSSWNAYNKVSCPTDCIQSQMDKISWTIRLPKKLFGNFWILNTSSGSLTTAQTKNDVIVNRQLRWKYHTGSTDYPFTIYSFSNTK